MDKWISAGRTWINLANVCYVSQFVSQIASQDHKALCITFLNDTGGTAFWLRGEEAEEFLRQFEEVCRDVGRK